IEGLEIGASVHAKELDLPAGTELAADADTVIVHIMAAPTAEQVEAELAGAEAELGAGATGAAAQADAQAEAEGAAADGATGAGGDRVVLAKPRSYMNESGGPVVALRDFFKLPVERIVVVHDELDLGFGVLRLKLGGGDNGHNGLKSLRRSLGSGEFHRVRV